MHTGATWWTRLNCRVWRQCSLFLKIFWPLVDVVIYGFLSPAKEKGVFRHFDESMYGSVCQWILCRHTATTSVWRQCWRQFVFTSRQWLVSNSVEHVGVLTDRVAWPLVVQPCSSGRCRETSRTAVDHRLSKLQSHFGPQEWVLAVVSLQIMARWLVCKLAVHLCDYTHLDTCLNLIHVCIDYTDSCA